MSKGTMDPAAFAALSDANKMSAAISGDAAGLPSDFNGETLEEIAKDLTGKLNLSGSAWLKAFFTRVPFGKLGIKITSIGVSNILFNWILSLTSLPQGTKDSVNLVGRNLLQGVLASYIDTSAERGNEDLDKALHVGQTSQYVNKVSPYDPSKAMVVVISDLATGFKMVHAAAHENGAYLDIPDSGVPAVPATTCLHCENAYANHTATFRKETTTTGAGKDGKGGGTKVAAPPAYRNAKRMLLSDAQALSGVFYCPETWPAGKPAEAKPAEKALTWKQKVGDDGIMLFDAVLLFPKTTASEVDDIKGPDIATEAPNVPIDEWANLAKNVMGNEGIYEGCWNKGGESDDPDDSDDPDEGTPGWMGTIERWFESFFGPKKAKSASVPPIGLTKKGFDLVLDVIISRGSGKLKPENVVKVISLSVWEKFRKEENWSTALKILALGSAVLLGYLAWAGVTLYLYGVSLFPGFDWWLTPKTVDGQAIGMFLMSISALLWFVVWYFSSAIQWATAGILKSELPATAKATTVLFCGTAAVAISLLLIDSMSKGVPFMPSMWLTVFVLTSIAGDRLHSMWYAELTIAERWKMITLGKLNAISALSTGAIAVALGMTAYSWIVPAATFQVAVEKNGGAFYVPTPKGGAFRPEDVLGRIFVDKIKFAMKPTNESRQVACLPKGVALDLPGYAESVERDSAGKDVPCENRATGQQWVVRENFWGRTFDGGAKEYGSLAELVVDAQKADAALKEALKVPPTEAEKKVADDKTKADAEVEATRKAKALVDTTPKANPAPAPSPVPVPVAVPAPTVAASESHADFCKRQAGKTFHTRQLLGCK